MHTFIQNYLNFIKNFLPGESQTSTIGLDIGVEDCKLVELSKSADGYELVSWAIEPIKNGDIASSIRAIAGRLKSPVKSFTTAVTGKGTLIRYLDMPRMSVDDLRKSFSIEIDKYFPFAQDQIYSDCYILDSQSKANKMSVIAAAAKKEFIDARVKLLTDAGFQPNLISLNAVALINAVNTFKDKNAAGKNTVEGILDMGHSVSSLLILIDGMPRFIRDIFIGGRDFTKKISSSLSISMEEAVRLKTQPGEQLDQIMSACDQITLNLIQELKLSIDYFMTEHNRELNKLVLTGGASNFVGLSNLLQSNLEIAVETWDPLAHIKKDSISNLKELNANANRLTVALGLAVSTYDRN